MMRVSKMALGTMLAFEYFDETDQAWKPRVAILRRVRDTRANPLVYKGGNLRRGRWLFLMFDVSRGAERSFYRKRMRAIRVVEIPAAGKTTEQARSFAEGFRDGAGPRWGVAYARQGHARVTHGFGPTHAVFAVEKQRETA